MTDNIETLFLKELYRPIDSYNLQYCENKNKVFLYNEYMNYANEVKKGMKLLGKQKIIVTGLIYNAESQISFLRKWFNELKLLCKECHIVIVENNSVDRTREFCQIWRDSDAKHVHLVCDSIQCDQDWMENLQYDKSPFAKRIRKMSFLRNKYVEYISHYFKDFDYIFVMDFDLRGTLFWDGVFHSIYKMNNNLAIDAVACNGMVNGSFLYYDSFAYAKDKSELRWNNTMDKQSHDNDVLKYVSKKYKETLNLDIVKSAFGGFCIYRFNNFVGKYYGYEEDKFTCEHCILHEQLDLMFVNPRMIFIIDENMT